jgi:hypothetical protein
MSSRGSLIARIFAIALLILCMNSVVWSAGLRIVPSSSQVTPGENFYFDVVADNIPASGLGGVQFRLAMAPTSGTVSGVSELTQAGSGDIAVVAPLLISPAVPGRSGIGDFFWNGKGSNGILVMENEPLSNGSAMYTFAHTNGSTPPSGSGVVARFAAKIGSGVKAEQLNINLSEVMLLDGGPAYPLEYANGASVQIQCIAKVPSLLGLDRNSAIAALTAAKLVSGTVYEINNSAGNRQLNVVLEQSVPAGNDLLCQSPVNVAINSAPVDVLNAVSSDKLNDESGTVVLSWTPSSSTDTAGYRIYSNTTLLKQVAGASSNSTEISGLANGIVSRLKVTSYDTYGNESSGIMVDALPKDDVQPVISIGGVIEGLLTRSDVVPSITVTDASPVTWSTTLNSSPFTIVPIITDGTYTLTVNAVDSAGNSSSKTVSFKVDKTQPTITLTNLNDNGHTSNATLAIAGTTTDANGINTLTVNGNPVVVNSDGSFAHQQALVLGSNAIEVVSTDKAGNQFSITRTVIRDVEISVTVNPPPNPTTGSSITLTGTMGTGISLNVSTTSTAAIGPITFPSAGNWSCTVTKLVPGANEFVITALDQSSNTRTVNVTVNYVPVYNISLSESAISEDFQGSVDLTVITGSPVGRDVFVEQFVDVNRNGIIDEADYLISSFKVTDGVVSANPNMQGDDDGVADEVIKTKLKFMLADDLFHAPGRYIFRASTASDRATALFTVNPVSRLQSISGMVTDGINPIPGAMVRMLDKWKRPVAWVVSDDNGNYVFNVKKAGDYLLLPVKYGYASETTPVSINSGQSIVNLSLAAVAGNYHVTGQVKDAAGSKGIAGIMVQAVGATSSAYALTAENGNYDMSLPAGNYAISIVTSASVPGAFLKGYVAYETQPVNVSVSSDLPGVDLSLTFGNIQVNGRILDSVGNPLAGIPVKAKQRLTNDNSEPVAFGVSDTNGNYSVGLFTGAYWDITLDDAVAQTIGYIGNARRDLSTDIGPLNGNDLTVYPVTAWVQGVVKDSENHLMPGVEVQLRNTASSIKNTILTSVDGTYRIGTYAGDWFVKAKTETTGTHKPVSEQGITLVDAQTAIVDFVVDVTPPALAINAVVTPTSLSTQTITGTMEAGSVITIAVDTTAVVGVVSYPTVTTWSCSIASLKAGVNNITVTATDIAENKTVKTAAITYNQPKLPDLVVVAITPPATAASSQTISIPVTVKNQGTATSGLFYIGLYLSTDSNITTADTFLSSEYVSSLAPGEQLSYATTVTIPANISGTYYIGAIADIKAKINESDEGNNSLATTPTLITYGPDLIVTSIGTPANASSGQTISIPVTVKNQGVGTSGLFYVGLYLSTDSSITITDTFLSSEYISSLAPGEQLSYTTSATIPANISGTYYIGAIADIKSKISESNEGNNSLTVNPTSITFGPDLVVSSISAPSTATAGQSVPLPVTVKNQGTGTAGLFYIGHYLSTDSNITTSDILLGEEYVSSLAPGAQESYTTTVTIPSNVSGSYYIGAIVDKRSKISESNEGNNSKAAAGPTVIMR